MSRFTDGISTLICVPLFCDWEEIYRNSDLKSSIAECWSASKKVFAKFQIVFFAEHLVALVPLIWLKVAVERRNTLLEKSIFKPVPDEQLSKQMINTLLTLGLVIPIVASLLQAGLAYLFFRFGHPWARVLKCQVLSHSMEVGCNLNLEVPLREIPNK